MAGDGGCAVRPAVEPSTHDQLRPGPHPTARTGRRPAPFARILCGINAGRPAQEAAREALAFAAGGAALHFLAISDEIGVGATRTALLSPQRADLALDDARQAAKAAGIPTTSEHIADPSPVSRLLEESRRHDLLVIGSPIRSRAPGMLLGETAGVALHRCGVPVLLARPAAGDVAFPAASWSRRTPTRAPARRSRPAPASRSATASR